MPSKKLAPSKGSSMRVATSTSAQRHPQKGQKPLVQTPRNKTLTPTSVRIDGVAQDRVQRYAHRLAELQHRPKIAVGVVLRNLVDIGLSVVEREESAEGSLRAALRLIDPTWTGERLEDLEPVLVTTSKSPVAMILDRRT